MSSYIDRLRRGQDEDLRCVRCGRKADVAHHRLSRCAGGSDRPENLDPMCFRCHHKAHASQGDWSRWGRRGGIRTAQQASNWLSNFSWARKMYKEAPDLWKMHVKYWQGKLAEKPPTLSEWRSMGGGARC